MSRFCHYLFNAISRPILLWGIPIAPYLVPAPVFTHGHYRGIGSRHLDQCPYYPFSRFHACHPLFNPDWVVCHTGGLPGPICTRKIPAPLLQLEPHGWGGRRVPVEPDRPGQYSSLFLYFDGYYAGVVYHLACLL